MASNSILYQPLQQEERARRHSPARRSRLVSPSACCTTFFALCGLAAFGVVAWLSPSAFKFAHKLVTAPHQDAHAISPPCFNESTPEQEEGLVRSFFGKAEEGGVETFDLRAQIWVRASEGEEGEPWRILFDESVLKDVPIDAPATTTTVPVRLPQPVLNDLHTNRNSKLQAIFAMLPPVDKLDRTLNYFHAAAGRALELSSPQGPHPPLQLNSDFAEERTLNFFLQNSYATQPLLFRPLPPTSPEEPPKVEEAHVVTSSWVTMAQDFPIYNREEALARLMRLDHTTTVGSEGESSADPSKIRHFLDNGHFESLIEFNATADSDQRRGHRYAPFLTTRLGVPGPLDYKRLPDNADSEDFLFSWRVTWAAAPPAKLLFGAISHGVAIAFMPMNQSEQAQAIGQDTIDALHSALGHSPGDGGRLATRIAIRIVEHTLFFATFPLDLAYWFTRSLSTGIPLLLYTVEGFAHIALSFPFFHSPDPGLNWFLLYVLGMIALITLKQLKMLLLVEVQWGGPRWWFPVGVSRRKATHSERASLMMARRFNWRSQLLIGVAAIAFYLFLPSFPRLITATPPIELDVTIPAHKKYLFDGLDAVRKAITLLHLNYRLSSFAGAYRIGALIGFLCEALHHAPEIFYGFFGDWRMRGPVTLDHALDLLLSAALAGQALRYKAVKQVEEVEE